MDFILENYLIIILVGLFFVFALIGYLIDLLRKDRVPKEYIPKDVQILQNEKLEEQKRVEETVNIQKEKENNKLLDEYDKKD